MMGSRCAEGDDVSSTPFSVESNAAEHAVCQDYLECVIAVTPEALLVAAQTYGPNGICWETLDSALCEKACMEIMARLAIASDGHPACVRITRNIEGTPVPESEITLPTS